MAQTFFAMEFFYVISNTREPLFKSTLILIKKMFYLMKFISQKVNASNKAMAANVLNVAF